MDKLPKLKEAREEFSPKEKFDILLGLFGNEKARGSFVSLCKEYNTERISQVSMPDDGENYRHKRKVSYSPPKRAYLHNNIMEIIGKLATQIRKPTAEQSRVLRDFGSREAVAEAINAYILAENGTGGGGEPYQKDMSETAYFHSLGREH